MDNEKLNQICLLLQINSYHLHGHSNVGEVEDKEITKDMVPAPQEST